jgi:hypothetical protein
MMSKRTFAASALALALISTSFAMAQEAGMVRVITQHVQLGQQQRFESLVPKLWDAFRKSGVTLPIFGGAGVSQPGAYAFVMPFSSFADLDVQEKAFGKAFASSPELAAELSSMTTSVDDEIWLARPDLGYVPASPRLQMEQQGFLRIALLYVQPAQTQALEAALKELTAGRKKHGIADGVDVVQLLIGADGPVYGVLVNAKDEIDFLTQNAKNVEKMGAEWQAWLAKTGPMMRRVEFQSVSSRPALNYTP